MTRSSLALVFAFLCAVSCRTGPPPEAGLPAEVFRAESTQLAANARGAWFAIVPEGTERSPWAVISGPSGKKLLYAESIGQRTARLSPASPFTFPLLEAHRGQNVELEWVTDLSTLAGLADAVGYLSGKPGEGVRWLGPAPQGDVQAVLVSVTVPKDYRLARWLVGTATIRDGALRDAELVSGAEGPFLVLPDGPISDGAFRVAAPDGVVIDPSAGHTALEQIAASENFGTRFELRPIAVEAGADVMVAPSASDPFGGGGAMSVVTSHPRLLNGVVLAVTEDALVVPGNGVPFAIRGLRAALNGNYLTSLLMLTRIQVSSGANVYAGSLRVNELAAAAGYVDWARVNFLADAPGLDGDTSLYIARAHAQAGDFDRAEEFLARSIERFYLWYTPTSQLGTARAEALRARLRAHAADWEGAAAAAQAASKSYAEGDDHLRAAEQELAAAAYSLGTAQRAQAPAFGNLARSRFYHGLDKFHTAHAEVELSEVYRRLGDNAKAAEMAKNAGLRFAELGSEVGKNRARLAEARVSGNGDYQLFVDVATKQGDSLGVADAAASWALHGRFRNDDQKTAAAGAIATALPYVSEPLARDRALQALAVLCREPAVSQSAVASVPAVAASCASSAAGPAKGGTVQALLERGHELIWSRDKEGAAALLEELQSMLGEELRQNDPTLAAEIIFFDATLARLGSPGSEDAKVVEGLRLLSSSIDPKKLAETLHTVGRRHLVGGRVWLADALWGAAAEVAEENGQAEYARQIAMARVAALHEAQEWDMVATAVREAEPIVRGSTQAGDRLARTLELYSADATYRLGRQERASTIQEGALARIEDLGAADAVAVLTHAASLTVGRGDLGAAGPLIEQAERGAQSLARRGADESAMLSRARLAVVRGDFASASGDAAQAARSYDDANSVTAALTSPEALRVTVEALVGSGRVATTEAEVALVVKQLELVRGQAEQRAEEVVPLATEALIELELSSGRPGAAMALLEKARQAGTSPAPTTSRAKCLGARVAALERTDDAVQRLDDCLAVGGGRAAEARILRFLVEPGSVVVKKNTAERLQGEMSAGDPRTRSRLALAVELATPNKAPAARREESLSGAVDKAVGNPAKAVKAATALAEYYIEVGRPGDALSILEQREDDFYRASAESAGALAGLRARAMLHSLTPVETFNYVSRAATETSQLTEAAEAELLFYAAQNDVLLGMWHHAAANLRDAEDRAKRARARKLSSRIVAFAKRFGISLKDG